jgi:hypothetical protein
MAGSFRGNGPRCRRLQFPRIRHACSAKLLYDQRHDPNLLDC